MTTASHTNQLKVSSIRADNYDSLDQALFEGLVKYVTTPASLLDWIGQSVGHHLTHSVVYRRLADAKKFKLVDLEKGGDLSLVPLISSGSFKRQIFDVGPGMRRCTSSGTMGSKSVVPRDSRTLERFVGSIANGLREFIGHNELQHAYILGPRPEEAGDLWFSFSLSLAELFNDAEYLVQDETFDPARLYNLLSTGDGTTEPVIAAPPTLVLAFLDWMKDNDMPHLTLSAEGAWVITAGGWKRAAKEQIDRNDFDPMVSEYLGVATDHIRDVFNMVELNTIIFECERGNKHIPPWLSVTARNPRDLSILPPGEQGLLAYLDPTPLSYPGFVLSDDIGVVSEAMCPCGRATETLQLDRRLEVVEERGCGLKMERYAQGSDQR